MTTLEEKVQNILDFSDFNDLPFEERKRIHKYALEQQILTIWQTLMKDKHLTTEAWRTKQRAWLKNCVELYRRDYSKITDQTMNALEKMGEKAHGGE